MADDKKDDAPKPPYDQGLANAATAIDHCLKLGGVIIEPQKRAAGFKDKS